MNAVAIGCILAGFASSEPEAVSSERIKGLVKKLEVPTRDVTDQREGPPEGSWPTFNYKWHVEEIRELKEMGEEAVPALLVLLENKSKPGQTRAHAVAILAERIVGRNVKPDSKIIAAINAALKEKEPALRFGALRALERFGLATNCRNREQVQNDPQLAEFVKKWLPVEEVSFSNEVMNAFLPQVIAALLDEHPEVARSAAYALHSFGVPKIGVSELVAAFKRSEPEVRGGAALALGRVGKDDPVALKAMLEELGRLDRYTGYSDQQLVNGIVGFGPKAKDAVPALIGIIEAYWFKSPHREGPYRNAITALGAIGPDAKAAIPVFLRLAERCNSSDLNLMATALDQIDPESGKQVRAIENRKQNEFKKWVESFQMTPVVPNPPGLPIKP